MNIMNGLDIKFLTLLSMIDDGEITLHEFYIDIFHQIKINEPLINAMITEFTIVRSILLIYATVYNVLSKTIIL